MTDLANEPHRTGATARKNLTVLVAAQAILGSQLPIHFVIGGLAGQMLTTEKCWATLPISMTVIGTMITAPMMSNIMQRHGRRFGFLLGALGGATGGAIAAYALMIGSFALFLLGSFFLGIYMASQGFLRFAAADTSTEDFRPKAISYTLAGGLVAALIGPQLVKITSDALIVPFMGGYLAIIALNAIGAMAFLGLNIPKPKRAVKGDYRGRSRMELLRSPRIMTAMICAMVSYALMNLVMTSTPLAVVGCGYTQNNAADVVSAHVIAMFAPSFFTGHLIARFGAERIIAIGLAILACAGGVALSGVELSNFFITLILLGLGWNFGFIGATTLLASEHRPEEQGRIQGMNDFAVFGLVSIGSVASGGLMNCSGGDAVQGWMAVNIAMVPFLLFAAFFLARYVWARRAAV